MLFEDIYYHDVEQLPIQSRFLELEGKLVLVNVQVLDDIFQTSLCICLKGQVKPETFKLLQTGAKRIQSFIHGEKYNIDSATSNASKAAYLSSLIANGITTAVHFDPQNIEPLRNAIIKEPLNTKLNKLRKSNIEAFFNWNEIAKMPQS